MPFETTAFEGIIAIRNRADGLDSISSSPHYNGHTSMFQTSLCASYVWLTISHCDRVSHACAPYRLPMVHSRGRGFQKSITRQILVHITKRSPAGQIRVYSSEDSMPSVKIHKRSGIATCDCHIKGPTDPPYREPVNDL